MLAVVGPLLEADEALDVLVFGWAQPWYAAILGLLAGPLVNVRRYAFVVLTGRRVFLLPCRGGRPTGAVAWDLPLAEVATTRYAQRLPLFSWRLVLAPGAEAAVDLRGPYGTRRQALQIAASLGWKRPG